VWLKKQAGGTTIKWEGQDYHWPGGDPVCEVPQALGQALLGIHGGGYSEISAPPKPAPKAPAAKAAEPAKT
jgi:hypothetical protein